MRSLIPCVAIACYCCFSCY